MTRRCSKCGEYKDEEEFPFKFQLLGRRHSECKDCRNKYQADYYQRTKDQRLEYKAQRQIDKREEARHLAYEYLKNSSCADCGETDPLVLTFDHVRGKKKMNVSQMVAPGRLELEAIARMHEHVALVQDEVLLQSQVPLWYPQVENRKRSLLRFSIEVVI